MEILESFEINDTVRPFVEKEVHDGQIRNKAVFLGKDLEIRLFQSQPLKNIIFLFGVDDIAEVATERRDRSAGRIGPSLGNEIVGDTKIDGEADLFEEEADEAKIQFEERFGTAVQDGEEFITIIFEIGRTAVSGSDGAFVLGHPIDSLVDLDL